MEIFYWDVGENHRKSAFYIVFIGFSKGFRVKFRLI